MALFFEDKDKVGQPGGLHALVIGISDYPNAGGKPENFGLGSVDGPAVSAWRLAQLLLAPPAGTEWIRPLRTVRLLLAPSAADLAAEPTMAAALNSARVDVANPGRIGLPTFDGIEAAADGWRQNCDLSDDEAALFFFAGHGLRFEGSDCLVGADFGLNNRPNLIKLDRCVRFDSLFDQAMIGPEQGGAIARRQFWFVDACRVETAGTSNNPIGPPRDILTPRAEDATPIERPGLWSTGSALFARAAGPGGQTPFGAALVSALKGAVLEQISWPPDKPVRDIWPVTGSAIKQAVTALMRRDPQTAGQVPAPMGQGGDEPLLIFAHDQPPLLQARISLRAPAAPANLLLNRADGPPPGPIQLSAATQYPYVTELVAGFYLVQWTMAGAPPRQRGWFASLGRDELTL